MGKGYRTRTAKRMELWAIQIKEDNGVDPGATRGRLQSSSKRCNRLNWKSSLSESHSPNELLLTWLSEIISESEHSLLTIRKFNSGFKVTSFDTYSEIRDRNKMLWHERFRTTLNIMFIGVSSTSRVSSVLRSTSNTQQSIMRRVACSAKYKHWIVEEHSTLFGELFY